MIRIHSLRLDGGLLDSPRGRLVGDPRPVLSWAVESDGEDAKQFSYSVEFRSGEKLIYSVSCESGVQRCGYDGPGFEPGERIDVRLTVVGDKGSSASVDDWFIYIRLPEWTAPWIEAPGRERHRPVIFRKEINIPKKVESAMLWVCGVGYQKPEIDGVYLCNSAYRLDPSMTDYEMKREYVAYPEVKKKLGVGTHILSVTVADGWRDMDAPAFGNIGGGPLFSGDIQLSALLRIKYADGSSEDIVTGEDWTWTHGRTMYANIFNGETFDSRAAETVPAPVRTAPSSPDIVMSPMTIPPIADRQYISPSAVWRTEPGRYIVDFGQNIAGVPMIKIDCGFREAGGEIVMRTSETLDEDGGLYTATLRGAASTDRFICGGDYSGTWAPEFTYHGFRYVEIAGYPRPLVKDDVTAVVRSTAAEKRGSFTCGSALINAVQEMVVATERNNMHSILTDCPQRDERMGWMNDATVRFEETPYNFETARIWPKVTRDILDAQRRFGTGAFICTAPSVWGGNPADPVCSSFLVAGWEDYIHNANVKTVAEAYEGYKAWEDVLLSKSDGYIVNYSYYGDWAGPAYACDSPEGAKSAVTPGIFMSTGYSYLNCRLIARFAGILGREDDKAKYLDIAEKIKTAMLDRWYAGNGVFADKENGSSSLMSQACQVFPCWLGILEGDDARLAVKAAADDIRARGGMITTGNLCTRYLFDMLSEYGELELAYELITREDYPSYGFMR
ncbi:MAG: family 78 glycoside hydrolase catalytic domain, partial [Clostridiales bacterium]|nr:family 78 glycoside hydrolase catalytic domain [Clostridiales bacterium]